MRILLLMLIPFMGSAQGLTELGYQYAGSKFATIHGGYSFNKFETKLAIGIGESDYYGIEAGFLAVKEVNFHLALSTQFVWYNGGVGFTMPQLCPIFHLNRCTYLTTVLSPTHVGLRLRSYF